MVDDNPQAAAALLLQLDTYARPSEIVSLEHEDVIKPVSKHCKFWGVIFGNSDLGHTTKTKTQDDTVLLDSLDRDYAPGVLKMVVQCKRFKHGLLFPELTLAGYEAAFRTARQSIGLAQFQLTPRAVRHSGPSVDSLNKSRCPASNTGPYLVFTPRVAGESCG
eukprot:s2932_g2.t1